MAEDLVSILKNCDDQDFFINLGRCVPFRIPVNIRNILKLNYYTNVTSLAQFDDSAIQELEAFMRNDFETNMIPEGEQVVDYLGPYTLSQQKFKLLGGQTRIIKSIVEYCQRISSVPGTDHSQSENVGRSSVVASERSFQDFLFDDIIHWMKQKPALAEVLKMELQLKVESDSYTRNPDDSISCTIKCTVPGCDKPYKVTAKSYPTYHKRKRVSRKPQKLAQSKWHFTALKEHLLQKHSTNPSNEDTTNESPENNADGDDTNNQSGKENESPINTLSRRDIISLKNWKSISQITLY